MSLNLPPEPPLKRHLIFGTAIHMMKDPLHFLPEHRDKMPGIFRLTSSVAKLAVVNKPEWVDYVLRENNKNYVKSRGYKALKVLLGNGLLTSEGEFWLSQRRLMQPAFYKERLSAIVETMEEEAQGMINDWETHYPEGGLIDVTTEMNKIALRIVSKALFKAEVENDVDVINRNMPLVLEKGADRFKNPLKLPIWVPTPENIREKRAILEIEKIILKIIHQRRKNPGVHSDLLDMLMQATDEETGKTMSDTQLKDEAMTIFLAGHETSANVLGYALYSLSRNPELIDKILAEGFSARDLNRQDSYLTMVINETMRLYPPAWIIGRRPLEQDKIGDYDIPTSYNVLIPTYSIHRDPKYWENPDYFIPDRFSKPVHKNSFLPFGGGPRLCIGNNFALYETKIVLYRILERFRIEPDAGYELELKPHITMRPGKNIRIKFYRR